MNTSSVSPAAPSLIGASFPKVSLRSTSGESVSPASLPGWTVLFFYPRTGNPAEPAPVGLSDIPGTKGCTPQACGFRNAHGRFLSLGVENIFGVSSQEPEYQAELAQRLCLTYPILSDPSCALGEALGMKLIQIDGQRFYARATLVLRDGVVVKVFDDIEDPENNCNDVLFWIVGNR